jgi:hypothetical protein
MEWAKLGEPVAQPFRYQQEHCAVFHLHNHIAAAAALHNYLIASPQMAAKICIQRLSINLHQSHHAWSAEKDYTKPPIIRCLRLMPPCVILVHGQPRLPPITMLHVHTAAIMNQFGVQHMLEQATMFSPGFLQRRISVTTKKLKLILR